MQFGSSVLSRPFSILRSAANSYSKFSGRYGNFSAFLTGGVITGAGDFVSQTTFESRNVKDVDWRRTGAMATFGCLYSGLLIRNMYRKFDSVIGFGRHSAAKKTLLDVFVHIPVSFVPTFYLSTNLLRGRSLEEACVDLKKRYVETVTLETGIWLPVQAFNFSVVPVPMRVLFMCGVGFLEKLALCSMANSELEGKNVTIVPPSPNTIDMEAIPSSADLVESAISKMSVYTCTTLTSTAACEPAAPEPGQGK